MSLNESIKVAQIDLVKELGINELPQDQKKEMLAQMSEIIQQRIVLKIVDELPEDKKEEFANIINASSENPSIIDEFLQKNLPNVEELVLGEIGKYKKEMLEFLDNPTDKYTTEEE